MDAWHGQKGFSLVEMTISLAIISIIALALASFSSSSFSLLGKVNNSSRVSDTITEVKNTLTSKGQCLLNLKDKDLSLDPINGVKVDRIAFHGLNSDGTPTGQSTDVIAANKTVRGLRLKSILLKAGPQIQNNVSAATLKFEFENLSTKTPEPMTREIPIFVRTQANKVTDCWINMPRHLVVHNQICNTVSYGTKDAVDPLTGACMVQNTEWFSGTPSKATCPGSTYLAPGADEWDSCQGDVGNWVDTSPFATYRMADGTLVERRKDPVIYRLDKATKTCTCSWATDIAPADLATFKCQINCVVP